MGCGGMEKCVLSSVWSPEAQARKAQTPVEMGEQHLDFLPTATGLHVFWSRSVRMSHVARVFMQIPRDLAGKSVRAALGFEFADVAIQFAGAIEPCPLGRDAASWIA